jgi:DNA polymerase
MVLVYWDIESFSKANLKASGAHIYAADPSTGIHFFCYAVDNDAVRVWRPGDPVPEPFTNPGAYGFVADNWVFEREMHARILGPRYGFPSIPLENQDCAQRLALASCYPAELGLRCTALGLPYKKDIEARKAMLRLTKPPAKKPTDPGQRERDLVLLEQRCRDDVIATRACYRSQLLRPLPDEERTQLRLDAEINDRGIGANIPFLAAMRDLAVAERNAINTRLIEVSECAITSVDQVERIKRAIKARGFEMESLGKNDVAAALEANPDEYVCELLTLRQGGAYASVRVAKRLIGFATDDGRIRGALRFCGAGPGRWTSPGPQLQNLKRNDDEYPGHLIDAVLTGDKAELSRYGNPLAVAAQLSRAALCAREGHVLICADFASIESRVLAWFAGETWKLDSFREFDRLRASGDKEAAAKIENYRIVASRMLGIPLDQVGPIQRQQGKGADLSCGYGGALGAWRCIMGPKDKRSDDEIKANIQQWWLAHPRTRTFWRCLERAVHNAIRLNTAIPVQMYPEGPTVTAAFDGEAFTLTLPSGRAINYPGARLVPNGEFEDGAPDVEHFDNAKGQWKPVRAWFGLLVENLVQGTARDLLAAGLLRFAARGWPIVFHCHDEIVIEVPEGSVVEADVLAALIEPPPWAEGLPLGGKVHSGRLYFEEPDAKKAAKPLAVAVPDVVPSATEGIEHALDAFVAGAGPTPVTAETERDAEKEFLNSLTEDVAPLWDMVTLPMDSSNRVSCPFHDDPNPSCVIYADHYNCMGCSEHGNRLDWLTKAEGMSRPEAIAALQDWTGPGMGASGPSIERQDQEAEKLGYALGLWEAAVPLAGTIGERYLAETRKIDVTKLPATIDETLRFHKWCPFGGRHVPCIIALMRDPETGLPTGIHRIGLQVENGKINKIDRMALGHMGVVKLWPLNGGGHLVVGEGIETVLAAATRIPYRGAPLAPAWSAISAPGVARFPVIGGVIHLTVLVDNDKNGEGQRAAETCRQNWIAAGRQVTPLMPNEPDTDFNDIIMRKQL